MKSPITHKRGFTLIELLTVIAIIGILAGILIPTVGAVRRQANIAATKSQYSGYVNAMLQFRSEYGFFPTFGGGTGETVTVTLLNSSRDFIETLSARNATTGVATSGLGDINRRQISFLSFSDNEFYYEGDEPDPTQLADRFNNRDIRMYVDGNNNGRVDVPSRAGDGGSAGETVRSPVVFVSWPNRDEKFPEVLSWK